SLQFLGHFFGGVSLVTIREPRDAVASLLQRFHHDFKACVREVSAGAACLVTLVKSGSPHVLRYEDRFYDHPETIARWAACLGVRLSRQAVREIHEPLTPDRVQRQIGALQKAGVFGRVAGPDSFDPRTHWHPGHVGDREVGKYGKVLSRGMQNTVLS